MTSCNDDFSLLAADDHHLHQQYSQHHHPDHRTPPPNDAVFVNPYESGEFDPEDANPNKSSTILISNGGEKRKERDDVSEGGTSTLYSKELKRCHQSNEKPISITSGGEYRKDREEWSDSAIECLLDAYTDKYTQLNRGNLRGRDWEEVAVIVSDRCENQSKSVEQCKNKVDNLKKRYKLERHRMSSTNVTVSHWPWFKKMEEIVANSGSVKAVSDEEKLSGASSSCGRQPKRYIGAPCSVGQINNWKSKPVPNTKWQRVVFKISGAALMGNCSHSVDPKVVLLIAREVAVAYNCGLQVAIVIGGRNFFCGDTWINATGADRCTTHQIGMMATVMNSLLLQSSLEKMGVQTRVQTALTLPEVCEPYNRQRAIRHLEKGRVVIFGGVGGGSGNPLFSTDTTAALRATEINAQAVLKGSNVDSVYDCNLGNSGRFEHISFRQATARGPTPMDMMALTFCEENGIPVVIFNLLGPGNISRALCGEEIGTRIDQTGMISEHH